ncbi:Mpo1-like protein, partial [Algoriella sp.]
FIIGFIMILIMLIMEYFISLSNLQLGTKSWILYLAVFIITWILQFVGHKIEGKKPSFIKDLQFLLVGPIWLLGFILRKVGIKY